MRRSGVAGGGARGLRLRLHLGAGVGGAGGPGSALGRGWVFDSGGASPPGRWGRCSVRSRRARKFSLLVGERGKEGVW